MHKMDPYILLGYNWRWILIGVGDCLMHDKAMNHCLNQQNQLSLSNLVSPGSNEFNMVVVQ